MSEAITGIVQEIQETKTYPKKDGKGNIDITKLKIANKFFTCFDSRQLENIEVGSEVDVTYTAKENTYEGKTYVNNNISVLKLHQETPELSPETQAKVDAAGKVMKEKGTNALDSNFAKNVQEALKGTNTINLGDKTFKVTIEEI